MGAIKPQASLKPPSKVPANTGGRVLGDPGAGVQNPSPVVVSHDEESTEGCKHSVSVAVGQIPTDRAMGSLSALCRRDAAPLRLALTALCTIDSSSSKTGFKQGRDGGTMTVCTGL